MQVCFMLLAQKFVKHKSVQIWSVCVSNMLHIHNTCGICVQHVTYVQCCVCVICVLVCMMCVSLIPRPDQMGLGTRLDVCVSYMTEGVLLHGEGEGSLKLEIR